MYFSTTRFSVLFGCFFWSGLLVSIVHAEDIYIAQTARGSDTGASSANAHSIAWFNSDENWATVVVNDGKIGPGDKVHFVGTLTTAATIQGSGRSGSPITFEWDADAKFSAPTWTVNGAIQIGDSSYLIFDGKNTGRVGARATVDPNSWNVSIECTNNGTLLGNQAATRGIVGVGGNNITIKNMRIRNLYVRQPYSADVNEHGAAMSVSVTENASVENCYISEGADGVSIKGSGTAATGLNVSDCTITRVSNGIKPAAQSAGDSIVGATILRNRIDGLDVWNNYGPDGGDNHHHSDGIQTILGTPGTRCFQITVAYNWIGPNLGLAGHTNCGIFLEDDVENCLVYNNFVELAPGHWTSNAAIMASQGAGWTTGEGPGLVANNTVIAHGTPGAGIAYDVHHHSLIGNVSQNLSQFITHSPSTGTLDYGVYWGPTSDRNGECYDGISIYASLASWQSAKGLDTHSKNQDPKLNPNGTLQAGSPAIDMAPSQSAIFTDDFFGNQRTGAWDAGAFEFGATGGGGSAPTPTPASTPTPSPSPSPSPSPTSAPSPASTPAASGANVALAANGGVASASSTLSSNYAVNGVNNGDRTGAGWALGSGGWNDATPDTYPDWVEIAFSGSRTINEVDVFTFQDHPGAAPTESMTFGTHGITAFDVQYWNGSAWINVPGGQITGNNLVWRKLTFSGISTSKIRVVVNSALGGYSRIVEIEAYSSSVVPAPTPSATPTPAPTSSPSPTPTSGIPTAGESFAADSVELTSPFGATDGYVSQPSGTSLEGGGSAVYKFTVPDHGEYAVVFEVDAAHTGSNSLYLNVDADPQDPVMVWDIPVTTGFQARVASWRGGGTFDANQFVPKYFLLSPGQHDLIVRGREGNTKFKTITILKRPDPPNDLVIP